MTLFVSKHFENAAKTFQLGHQKSSGFSLLTGRTKPPAEICYFFRLPTLCETNQTRRLDLVERKI